MAAVVNGVCFNGSRLLKGCGLCVDICHLSLVSPSKARCLKSVNGLYAAILDSSLCSE